MTNNITAKLALIDLDNTITKKNTMIDFARWYNGYLFYVKFLLFIVCYPICHPTMLKDGKYLKEKFLTLMFKNNDESEMYNLGKKYFLERGKSQIKVSAEVKLSQLSSDNYKLVIVTGSLPHWATPFADYFGAGLLATDAEFFLGKANIIGDNNIGEAKLKRVKSMFKKEIYSHIVGYGDSKKDLFMGEFCHDFYLNKL